jgi:hypothetical protein
VQRLDRLIPLHAQIAAAHQFIHTIANMSKTQIGNGVDLPLGHIGLKIIFHRVTPYIKP